MSILALPQHVSGTTPWGMCAERPGTPRAALSEA